MIEYSDLGTFNCHRHRHCRMAHLLHRGGAAASAKEPRTLASAPDIPIEYLEVGGNRLRYIKSGKGPVLVLLHTLRTQLDLFEKVIPDLSKHFTVYALDYPGHGYSDIPSARYDAAFFTNAVEGFLEKLNLRDVTLAGVSIAGSIALIIAARRNARVARAIAINPYDYAKGRGMGRSTLLGWFVTYASLVPVIGETVMRPQKFIHRGGGPTRRRGRRRQQVPPALVKERYLVGNRPGQSRAFLSLFATLRAGRPQRSTTGELTFHTCFLGSRVWATAPEREHDGKLIGGVKMMTVERSRRGLALDGPASAA